MLTFAKIIWSLLCFTAIFGVSVAVSIYGWGLAPQNWWIITGGYLGIVFLTIFNAVVGEINKDSK